MPRRPPRGPRAVPGRLSCQARAALTPAAFSVAAAEQWALHRAEALTSDPFRLLALWSVSFLVQADPSERKTRYTMRIAQAEGYGRSGGLGPGLPDPDPDLVGQDTRRILRDRRWKDEADRAAITDLVIGQVSRPADDRIVLDETLRGKYTARAEIFADEATRVLQGRGAEPRKGNRRRVLVVGATAGILHALLGRGLDVCATDLSSDVVGRTLGGVRVLDGRVANARLMKDAELSSVVGVAL